jgi:2-hydroxychromene-2-carboxylate isomerase
MTVTVDFYYDLVSPNTYLANKLVPGIAERTGATFNYIPFLLGGVMKATGNQPPWMTFAKIKPKMAQMVAEMERFIKRHGVSDYKMNPHFPMNSMLMMRGAVAAEFDDRLMEYLAVGEKLVWEQGFKMDDPEVYAEAFTSAGFDGAALVEKTQEDAVKAKLIEYTNQAVERGAFGAPTFFVGKELFFGKDQMEDLEYEITQQVG